MFINVKKQLQEAFKQLVKDSPYLFVVDLEKDVLWNAYLDGFKDSVEKQEHNCNSCRSFIKNYGGVVGIVNGKIRTIWNFIVIDQVFSEAIGSLDDLVKNAKIKDIFRAESKNVGVDKNLQRFTQIEGKQTPLSSPITWNHFSLEIPSQFVNNGSKSIEAVLGEARDSKNVFKRSLDELTKDSIETVLELIAQGSLYRGDEFKGILTEFLKFKKEYIAICAKPENGIVEADNYCWVNSAKNGAVTRIRNTSIGTLLIDLSEGKELDIAVAAFERVVAPTNYKRPTALVTKKMIEEAEKTINELGYTESLGRRFASAEDISVNNLLYVNRDIKKKLGVFDELKEDVAVNPKSLKKVEEITIDTFIKDVLPTVKSVELLLERQQLPNLVSVITAKDKEAPTLFKWNNPFSWCYSNAVTDSIKENVKAAGGKIDGVLRFSIQWNEDGKSIIDLDAHAHEPTTRGQHIYYGTFKGHKTPMNGMLDVDMINPRTVGIENIFWTDKSRLNEGVYTFRVHNFSGHKNFDGVRCQIEMDGEIHEFSVNKPFTSTIDIAKVTYSNKDGFKVESLLEGKQTVNSTEKWGVSTNKFHKVSMIMNSPNYWEKEIGNKHHIFILEGAKNDEPVRGFFNEFLKDDLTKDKRVFEVLGGKLKVEPAEKQLSGVGFSTTQRNHVICKVNGKFERLVKIQF